MNNIQNYIHKIKHFKKTIFDPRTYENFIAITKSIIALRSWKQADLALFAKKTLRQVQYFFNGAKWNFWDLNIMRLKMIRQQFNFKDQETDFAILDGSAIAKNKDSFFKGLVDKVYSNKDKKIVNGFYLFGASIMTPKGQKYILDFKLFFKKNYLSETEAWVKFTSKVVKKTKAFLFILDSGFRGKYFCKYLFEICRRHFLIRIDKNQLILVKNDFLLKNGKKRGRKAKYPNYDKFKINNLLTEKTAIHVNHGRMWIFKDVFIKSWFDSFKHPVQVVVFWKDGFKKPMVLASSVSPEDFNNEDYFRFVEVYYKRWSIEILFKEVKSWFCFENFQLISFVSIMKFLHLVVFCHTLLTLFLDEINQNCKLKYFILDFLKRTRNIKKKLTVIGLKLFFESINITNNFGSQDVSSCLKQREKERFRLELL